MEVRAVVAGNVWCWGRSNFLTEPSHVLSEEGRLQRTHLEDNTAESPHVTLGVVAALVPDLRRHVVRCADLCASQALLHELGAAEVPNLDVVFRGQENILGLDVSVEDTARVELLQAFTHLNEVRPNHFFANGSVGCGVLLHLPVDVASFRKLHDDVEIVTLNKRIAVAHNVGVVNRRKDTNLVDGVLSFFGVELL